MHIKRCETADQHETKWPQHPGSLILNDLLIHVVRKRNFRQCRNGFVELRAEGVYRRKHKNVLVYNKRVVDIDFEIGDDSAIQSEREINEQGLEGI